MILPISRKHSEQLCCFATKHFVKKTHVLLEIDLFLIQNTCYLLQRGSVFLNLQPRIPLKLSGISKSSFGERRRFEVPSSKDHNLRSEWILRDFTYRFRYKQNSLPMTKAWIAGLLEGDGGIYVSKKNTVSRCVCPWYELK